MSAPGTILAAREGAQAVTSSPCGALHPMLPKILGKMRFLQPRLGSLVCRARKSLARPAGLCRALTYPNFVLVGNVRPASGSTPNVEGADAAGNASKASNQQRSDYDGPPLNTLLVGSTGHGKSALGNFLLNPSMEHIWEKLTFQVGDCRRSCTQSCSIESSPNGRVKVMDTPGLNESHARDLPNMIEVVASAHQLARVHAVILVMKVDSRMDQTYKDTLLYYQKLLTPKVFNANLIIVLSGFKPGAMKYRMKPQLASQIFDQTAADVKELLGLPKDPIVHGINSLPETSEELDESRRTRNRILRSAGANLAPSLLRDLKVPKTQAAERLHMKRASRIEGQISQKQEQLTRLMKLPDPIKLQVKAHQDDKDRAEQRVRSLEDEIRQLDSTDLEELAEWSTTAGWGVGSHYFSIATDAPIQKIKADHHENAYYCETNRRSKLVEGYFSRDKLPFLQQHGRYRVICYGYKRDKHAKALAEKRAELQEMTRKKNVALVKMQDLHMKHPELENPALAQIESEIRSLQEQVRKLKSPFFATLEEAKAVAQRIAHGEED